MVSSKRRRCFVIMPFSKTTEKHTEEYWTKHFRTFLKPLIEECPEVEAYRSEPLRGDVLRQIITELVVSPIVVADLTDRNPNVFLELGIRQSFKHGTVTIAEKGTEIPFDVSVKGILFYHPKDYIKNAEFTKQFKKAIRDCLSHPDSPDSLVLETISGRGTLYEIIRRDETARRVKALISECKRNIKIMNSVYDQSRKNKKNPKKRAYTTKRLLFCALELLITQRYLDEDDSFYEFAESFLGSFLARNEQLAVWEQSPDLTESWFLDDEETFGKALQKYKERLQEVQKKLII